MIPFTLARYFAWRFLGATIAVFGGVFVLIVLIDYVELTRRAFAAADAPDISAVMTFVTFSSVWDATSWGFGVYEGRRAIRQFLEDWIGSFEEFGRVAEEIVDLGDGVVYAVSVTRGRPAGSRGQIELRGAVVCLWEDGELLRATYYRDPGEARVAAEELAASRR